MTLYPTLTDSGPLFHVRVGDEGETEGELAAAELQIEMAHWSPADQIEVTLDEVALPAPVVRDAAAEDAADPSDVFGKRLALLEFDLGTGGARWSIKSGCGC